MSEFDEDLDTAEMEDDEGWGDDKGWEAEDSLGGTGGTTDEDLNGDDSAANSSFHDSSPVLVRSHSYLVLDEAALRDKQNKLIASTAEVLDVTPDEAGCLLRRYGWKSKKLQSDWFENQKKVRDEVGLTDPAESPLIAQAAAAAAAAAGTRFVQCESAYCDEVPIDQAHALACGHWFCNDCWSSYLTSKLRDGSISVFTTCMGMKCQLDHPHKFGCSCKEMVPEHLFFRYVTDKSLLDKYSRWLLDSFVEGQRVIRWCPRPGCTHAVSYSSGGTRAVTCKCGHQFCFSCGSVAHTPAPCDLVSKWMAKDRSDEATEIWLQARTKACPQCNVRIEKNRACNHMVCIKCNHNFCWLCKGPWASHGSATGGYYVCNRYDQDIKEGKVSSEETKIQQNQRLLQKYTYYYKRFRTSADAIKFTQALREKLDRQVQDQDLSKFSFLNEAIDKLIASRSVLMWTYSLSYFLKSGKDKHLFEYQQDMLSGATEALQDIMDNNDASALLGMRKDIINRTYSIDKFRQEMVAQVERGDFEDLLLANAELPENERDGITWTCVNCRHDNKREAPACSQCMSCKMHGEPECKACKVGQR